MRARVRFAHTGSTGIIEAGVLTGKVACTGLRNYPSFCFVLVLSGSGRHRRANDPWKAVKTGDLIVVIPDEPHDYGPVPGTTWDEVFLSAAGPLADLLHRGRIFLPHEGGRVWRGIGMDQIHVFTAIADDFLLRGEDDGRLLARLHLWFADLAASGSEADGWLARAQQMLAGDLRKLITPTQVAAAVSLPHDRFRRAFRRATGMSATAYRMQARISAAKTLLVAHPEAPLAEIADATGFCSAFQFSRMFKRVTGSPPKSFRRG